MTFRNLPTHSRQKNVMLLNEATIQLLGAAVNKVEIANIQNR